ncbi:glucose-6-phosphate dehydrogenase [candidate division WWE3 bacterium]|uniref:Glucose-6-phosphate 1-dehydrogenase n=1 Tax=candidate division WWE3 bacterium TaxID=2053526 RepID=A0A955LL65_UNCKA|nr:glucose-6-phosphate dehydrogenase [candidate division WWE3 bacterium]
MESFVLVIFGITSNLARIKLIPALYDLTKAGMLPEDLTIIGVARSPMADEELHDYINKVLREDNRHHTHPIDQEVADKLTKHVHYLNGSVEDKDFYDKLETYLNELKKKGRNCDNVMYYLATYPELYSTIFQHLNTHGLDRSECGWTRVMVEKPIGTDLESAKELNALMAKYFTEDQIFRLDHYLGKETMQNILAFRFGNGIFEPLMTPEYIDHIQVTAAEDFGVGDRGGYYDTVGALKDVGQNHLLQMLTFAAMEQPHKWTNEAITKRRIEFLNSLKPDTNSTVLGQYQGYGQEKNVNPDSKTDTFFSFKAIIGDGKLAGVPAYFRGGKELAQYVTEISMVFRTPSMRMFKDAPLGMTPNALIYRIQPNEGIVLKILTKRSQHKLELEETYMQYCYKNYASIFPDPYERLIHDAFVGDQTFFVDAPEVEAQWQITDMLVSDEHKIIQYAPGGWGPEESKEVIKKDGREWLEPSLAFCSL